MIVMYGWVVDGAWVHIADKEYPESDRLDIAEAIANDYLNFKRVVDRYGNDTYFALPNGREDLAEVVNRYLDPILGSSKCQKM